MKRKPKKFKFIDTVKTTSGTPVVGCVMQVHLAAKQIDIVSFKTGVMWEIPYSCAKKISNKEADSMYLRLFHKLG